MTLQYAQVAGHILELAGARHFKANIVLEGGSIHVDGEGCVAVLKTIDQFDASSMLGGLLALELLRTFAKCDCCGT